MLIDRLHQFFESLAQDNEASVKTDKNDPQIAATALFHHLIEADGETAESETQRLKEILSSEFDISVDEAVELYRAGQAADKDAVDLYSFTSVLKVKLDEQQKVDLVEILWDLAYADGHRHELEDHVIWRISDLLGVSARERVLARQRIEAERN